MRRTEHSGSDAVSGAIGVYRYGGTRVEVMQGWVKTSLPDGTIVCAVPMNRPEDVARAHALGYGGDVWAMTRDHDHFHALVAHALGMRESPALRDTAEGRVTEISGAEEEVVLALQRFVNLCKKAGKL